jgi:hypothetical protein
VRSIEAQNRAFSERLAMNHALLQKKYWFLPVDDTGHEDYVPVGRGKKTSYICGLWVSASVCKNVVGHKGILVDGMDCTDKIVGRHNHLWCHSPLCPVCFIRGWSVRGAKSIAGRLEEGVRRGFGKIEHVTVSPRFADRDLPEPVLREKCRLALVDRGVTGGEMTFHGYRIDDVRNILKFSPHYHCEGFIEGLGFDRCRECVHAREDCVSCSGFKGREVRGYAKDGYLVKVHPARKTVFGTAHYLLNHATVRLGVKRFHVVTYFGKCGNRCYASSKSESEVVCPACAEEMVKCYHVGKRHLVKDIGDVDYRPLFVDDEFDEEGEPNYIEIVGGRNIE